MAIAQVNWEVEASATISAEAAEQTALWHLAESRSDCGTAALSVDNF